jgi:Zn-dependent peptidase ImmA (M78 family)
MSQTCTIVKKFKTSKKILSLAKAEMNLVRLTIQRLLKCVDLDTPTIPFFDVELDGAPQTIAQRLREFWKVPKGPIKNLIALLESKGFIVIQVDFESEDISGSGMFTVDRVPIIYVNKRMPMCRQRFTICHELFHIIAHVNSSVEESRDIEKEADFFSGEFLMPESDISRNLEGRLTIAKLADLKRYWQCSMGAILTRAKQVRAISDRHAKTLWIQMGSLGFRKAEPPELEPVRESPQLMKLLFKTLKEELSYSDEEICDLLCLDKKFVTDRFFEIEPQKVKLKINSQLRVA